MQTQLLESMCLIYFSDKFREALKSISQLQSQTLMALFLELKDKDKSKHKLDFSAVWI